eukprot:CAMPEP_0168489454 /NCGR_PEP_ID=MMETSP0228-20121227/68670_1 /TAXON_ID=133427 /ORGANISM="Protoceratium reticulatum, Strain CCCM 535 (=CCMP 1889)" /LENGTH=38 /DNA_ID= /DNA_START= /DNA_END= /DNA_ORIENTATION=
MMPGLPSKTMGWAVTDDCQRWKSAGPSRPAVNLHARDP